MSTHKNPFTFEVSPTVILIVLILLMLGIAYTFIFAFVNFRRSLKNVPDDSYDESVKETKAENAVVLAKRTDGHYEGSHKNPTYISDFYVTFLTEGKSEVEYSVYKQAFETITIGQRGTLITIGGEFFDFGDGEEITE